MRGEAELFQTGRTPKRQPIAWPPVVALALASMFLCASFVVWVRSVPNPVRPVRLPELPSELTQGALSAYRRGDWARAEQLFREILGSVPNHARAHDYLERIELARRDVQQLEQARVAVASDPPLAIRLASAVAPNSPVFERSQQIVFAAQKELERRANEAREAQRKDAEFDLKVALGEALELYQKKRFDEAVARATELAGRAHGAASEQLTRWAEDARRFADLYRALPLRDEAKLARNRDEVRELIELDQRLGDGRNVSELREHMGKALARLAVTRLERDDELQGCAHAHDAATFVDRNEHLDAAFRRCDREAEKRVARARGMRRSRPGYALKLYREALALSRPDSSAYRRAESAIEALERPRNK